MPIPQNHTSRHLYHFTHLNNLEAVLRHNFLSYNEQLQRGFKHHSIALPGIQERRSRMLVPCGPGGVVHDYVPLYFSKLSPMLLQIVNSKNVDQELLLHFAYSIDLLDRDDVVFTGAAANTIVPPQFYDDPAHLDELDWAAIERAKWGSDNDNQKHSRMAEALVHKRLDPEQASYVLVWNDDVRKRVLKIYEKVGLNPPRVVFDGHDGHHSFTHFRKGLPNDMLETSISVGPIRTKAHFRSVLKKIDAAEGSASPEFSSLAEFVKAFQRNGLDALPETRELVGLESQNEVHKEDVGSHTLRVVECLRATNEYRSLEQGSRRLVKLAAYLHDIGKGPKSRWKGCGGKQQVDHGHPIRSTEMLQRILTESVSKPDQWTTRVLCMLVCYHDLIGDIIGRGRNREQLIGLVRDELELDMLIALGKADMSAVTQGWGIEAEVKLPELRSWAVGQLGDVVDEDEDEDED